MEYFPLCIDISRKYLKFSNTTYILSFRDTDYIFRIKQLNYHQALYKTNSKNRVPIYQFYLWDHTLHLQ